MDEDAASLPLVAIREVSRHYTRGVDEVHALQSISLDIARGRFVAFMGPSGSGKSTLLNLVSGIDRPDHGELMVAGELLNDLSEDELAAWRARHVGLIFQFFNLIPVLSARDNVALPLLLTQLDKRERRSPRRDRAARRRTRRPHGSPPAHPVGRRAAARRHRPRHRHRSGPDRRRRADRRSRRAQRRGHSQSAAAAEERVRQDHRHGHARPARAALRRRGLSPRQGHPARRRGGRRGPATRSAWRRAAARSRRAAAP